MRSHAWAAVALVAAALLLIPVGSSVAGSFGNHGSRVTVASGDFAYQLATLPVAQTPCLVQEEAGLAATPSDDNYYIHFTAAGCAALGKLTADILVGGAGTIGTLVTSSTGTYSAAVNVAALSIRYLEVDGKPGFTDLDWAYIDADQGGALTVGDIRLFTPMSAGVTPPTARYVAANEADILAAASATEDTLPTTINFQATALPLMFFDANLDGVWSTGDTLAADDGVNTRFLSAGDVFVSSSGSRTHGSLVGAASGTVPILLPVTNAWLVTTTNACAAPLNGDLYIHFGGFTGTVGTHIQPGDLILRKGGDTTTGAAASFMTRVSSTATGAGTAIQASAALTAAHFFYINNPSTPSGFGPSDWLYLDVNGVCGGAAGFAAGDLRITNTNGGTSFTGGSIVVTGNSDLVSYGGATLNADSDGTTPWYFLHRNADQSLGRPLTALTNAKFSDADNDDIWDPATEEAYIDVDSSGTVTIGDRRLAVGDLDASPASQQTPTTTAAFATVVDLEDDETAVAVIEANTDFKVTGPDGIFDPGAGESIVYSSDAWMTPTFDLAVITTGAIGPGAALAVLQTSFFGAIGTSDQFILQWARTGQTTVIPIHQSGDVILSSAPTFVTATSTDHVPTLTALSATVLARNDRTDGSPSEDAYYIKTGAAPPPLQTGVTIRLSPYDSSRPAGTILTTSDTQELGAGASVAPSATTFQNTLRFIDQGPAGIDPTDPLYSDLPVDVGGQNAATFGAFDIRVTAATLNSVTYTAGSIVQVADQDRTGFGTTWGTYAGDNAHRVYFFDENRDGAFNTDDILYAVHAVAAPAAFVIPDLLSVHLQGPGGATSNTAPPTSGGGVVTSTTTTTAPTSTLSNTSSSSTTTTGSDTEVDIAQVNQALQASLAVQRSGGNNVLTWTAETGVAGFQVFGSSSPFVLLATLGSSSASYTDAGAPADRSYVVTAFLAGGELTADQVNAGTVPGYTAAPTGEAPATTSQTQTPGGKDDLGFIPGPGLVPVVLALAALALVARRKL